MPRGLVMLMLLEISFIHSSIHNDSTYKVYAAQITKLHLRQGPSGHYIFEGTVSTLSLLNFVDEYIV